MSDTSLTNISNFTSKDRFSRLMSKINHDMLMDNQSHIQINNSIMRLSAPPRKGSGIEKLDSISASASSFTTEKMKGLADWAGLSTDPNKPEVINLSSEGTLTPANYSSATIIKDYIAPCNIALSSFDKMGKGIDEWIKDSLLVQMFHIKGADILCSSLCLLMSLLPCEVTNKIVDDIQKIKDLQHAVTDGINQAKATEKFGLKELNSGFSGGVTGLANIGDVKNSLQNAFSKPSGGNSREKLVAEIKNLTAGLSMVVKVINLLISTFKLAKTDPKAILGFLVNGMYDLLENVLLAVQALAIQIADKILNKVIAPVEKFFKKYPSMCGAGAQVLFKKILAVIYNFKKKILKFIADLFSFEKTARKKFKLFSDNMLWTMELAAILNILNLILGNFLDIAIACGVGRRPCAGEELVPNISQNFSGSSASEVLGIKQTPKAVQTAYKPETERKDEALDNIARKLEPMVNSIFQGSDIEIEPGKATSTMENVPPLIASMLTNMSLGENITISVEKNKAMIVYNNQALCGAR